MKTFSDLLSEYIHRVGVSDTELARRLGVSRQTIFRWREGRTSRPRHREDVLDLSAKLRLSSEERDALLIAGGFHPEGSVEAAFHSQSISGVGDTPSSAGVKGIISNFLTDLHQRWKANKKVSILITGLVLVVVFLVVSGSWRDVAAKIGFDIDRNSLASLSPIPASSNETLILVSEFANYGGEQMGLNIAGRIQETLVQEFRETGLDNVRVELLSQIIASETTAQNMGEKYRATIVIWGEYDSGRVIAVISVPAIDQNIEGSEQRWLITSSAELNSIVNTDLPRDVRWISLYVLGRIHLMAERYDQAAQVFHRALVESPEDASKVGRIYFFLGLVEGYSVNPNLGEVVAYYSEAIAQFPELVSAFNNRGVAYLTRNQAGDLERAHDDFREAFAADPSYEPAVINLAIALLRQDTNNLEEGIDLLLQFEANQTGSADLYNTLCWHLSLAGRPDEALPHCDLAVEMNPSGYTNDSRGLALALLGRYEEAAQEFQNFLDFLEIEEPIAYQHFIPTRSEWIISLEDGQNPFDAETLQALIE